ncbi:MAG TPA: hypothetical protein VNX68_09850 [Nitrosopumilaceae archaeon]|jgi:hypothetical protein|nr:hypothetical protein [Nitrosopumilaceae archaeon]
MKLSEAIRKGCKIARRQTGGELFEWNEDGKLLAACVLGAAILGSGFDVNYNSISSKHVASLREMFPELKKLTKSPRQNTDEELQDILVHLNDDYDMPRYQIARWLERKGL